jgi:hypothetical protein
MMGFASSRWGRLGMILGVVALAGSAVWANAPDRSVRPEARPGTTLQPRVPVRFNATVRPRPRSAWSSSNLRVLLDRQSTPSTSVPVVPAAAGVSTQTLPPAATTASAAPIVRFEADIRPRSRPWLDRTRPSGPAQTPLVIPALATEVAAADADEGSALASTAPVFSSPRPPSRPPNLQRRATVAATHVPQQSTPHGLPSGAICGDPAILGRAIPAIAGRLAGCGVANPVQVTSVHGITLSTAATMNCETAQALSAWTKDGAIPAVGNTGGGIAQFRVVAHYACRTRNSQPGARISEHGKGRAIDIAAFRLRNGDSITLLEGWRDRRQGRILRQMWEAACGPFGTVLGPEANRFHQDHFHFDTASYRSGSYCR